MPYRHSPWSIGSSQYGWGKELSHGLGLEPSELTLIHGDDTYDNMAKFRQLRFALLTPELPQTILELSMRCARRNRRSRGYVADISMCSSGNTSTPYLFTAVERLVYIRGGEAEFIFVWERAPTYASNCLASADVPIQEGTPIAGIPLPTFGSYTDAAFATWERGSLSEWGNEGLGPSVSTSDVDTDPWSWAPLPSLGASARRKLRRLPPDCA